MPPLCNLPAQLLLNQKVILSHQNVLVNAMQMRATLLEQIDIAAETWLCPLPLHHHFAFMFICWFVPLTGGKTLLASPREGEAFWQSLEQQSVSAILGVEPFYSMLLHHPDLAQLAWRQVKFSIACS